jgi:hypothetical protein
MGIAGLNERKADALTQRNLLRYEGATFLYDPYPVGVIHDVMPAEMYRELAETWPGDDLFQFKQNLGNKYSLSEVNNPGQYHAFLASCPPWLRFHQYIKSQVFVDEVLNLLCEHRVDLGLRGRRVAALNQFSTWEERMRAIPEKLTRLRSRESSLSVRFEFSMLPVDGGYIKPHTDAPQKLITIVLSMVSDREWMPVYGGGTSILRPRDITRNFNHLNVQAAFEEMEPIHTFEFLPNQALIFVKTFNSWHAVAPMTQAGSKTMRKTLTVNIESWS